MIFVIEGTQNAVLNNNYNYIISLQYVYNTGDINSGSHYSKIIYKGNITGFVNGGFLDNEDIVLSNSLLKNKIVVQKNDRQKDFNYSFQELGLFNINLNIRIGSCIYDINKTVKVFDSSYMYIGGFIDEFNFDVLNNISDNDVILSTFIASDETSKDVADLYDGLKKQILNIKHSEIIFINLENYSILFETLSKIQEDFNIDFNQKKIFIIDDTNRNIIKKFIAKLINQTGIKSLYLINKKEFSDILFNLSIGKRPYNDVFLSETEIGFGENNIRYNLSYIIDYLVFHGFPLDTIKLLLALCVSVLFISFMKQIIGLSSFGVYYPLIFVFSLQSIGLKTSIGLILVAFLTKMIINGLLKKLHILATPKVALYIIIYMFLIIISLTIYKSFGYADNGFVVFSNPMIFIALLGILMVGKKIRTKTIPFMDISWWRSILWFSILSYCVFLLINNNKIHNILLIYPEIIFLVLFLTVIIGRYSGLQILEIIRFLPLIKYLYKEKINNKK